MSDDRPKLAWVGDVIKPTGFATVTHSVLEHLRAGWRVEVLGINHEGDPHNYPYPIWKASLGGDVWGVGRFETFVKNRRPDAVIINNDPWIVADFLARWSKLEVKPPIVAYMPIDSIASIRAEVALALSELAVAVFYTKFGADQALVAGVAPRTTAVVPHGVDLERFRPVDRKIARRHLGLDGPIGDGFLLGNVNRNQPRKRLDLTIRAFSEWLQWSRVEDAWLYLHCDPDDVGWDLGHVTRHYGVVGRVIHPLPGRCVADDETMRCVYSALDAQVTTTLGEGWGLTQMEGLACGVPQLAPDWSALGEWMRKGAILVPCRDHVVSAGRQAPGVGGIVDVPELVQAIDRVYRHRSLRERLGREGREFVERGEFRWESVAAQIGAACQLALEIGARKPALEIVTGKERAA